MSFAYFYTTTLQGLIEAGVWRAFREDLRRRGIEPKTTKAVIDELKNGASSQAVKDFCKNAQQHIERMPNPTESEVPLGNDYGERTLAYLAQQDIEAGKSAQVVTNDWRAPPRYRKPVW